MSAPTIPAIVTITDAAGTGAAATPALTNVKGGIRKFVDRVPLVNNPNGLVTPNRLGNAVGAPVTTGGQYIKLALADSYTSPNSPFPVSDSYVIGLVEFYEKMHSDLPPTRQRGYVQLSTATNPGLSIPLTYLDGSPIYYPGTTNQVMAVDYPHFLGPTIVGTSNKAVRIKFYNLLPVGPQDPATGRRPGDLFLPVDETVMGSGFGPASVRASAGETYTQNRAAVHLHGNNTVWISDGTPHQWITPANETHVLSAGRQRAERPRHAGTVESSTDAVTLYYTNAMSARLMFYHDHAMGITRLNVYAGEAAGYVLTDEVDAGPDQRDEPDRRESDWPQGPSRHRHSARHPGQDLRGRRRRSSPRTPRGTGERARETRPGRSRPPIPATSGTPTSTCRPRTPGTSAA